MRVSIVLNCISKIPENYSNFPKKYIKKFTQFIDWETPKRRNYQRKVSYYKVRAYYDKYRPWSEEFNRQNQPRSFSPQIYLEPFVKFPIFLGDKVIMLTGKDKGKEGVVNYIVKERNWVFVSNLNLRKIVDRDSDGKIINIKTEEAPCLINRDVKLLDPEDKQETDIEWRYNDKGKVVRVSKRSQRIIPIPVKAFETADYKLPELYVNQEKDTFAENVKKITFIPKLKTFEMDIMEQMNIKEDRTPFPFYWY